MNSDSYGNTGGLLGTCGLPRNFSSDFNIICVMAPQQTVLSVVCVTGELSPVQLNAFLQEFSPRKLDVCGCLRLNIDGIGTEYSSNDEGQVHLHPMALSASWFPEETQDCPHPPGSTPVGAG